MIELRHVDKTYGSVAALDDVTFAVEPGRVAGFLGPNGAGKSTAMRVLLGLTPADSGSATILGRAYAEIPNPSVTVGSLLDASTQHRGRTGRETLAVDALAMGLERRRVDEVLDFVGLTPAESRQRIATYSLGMRQRLGLAGALLGRPRVLVLDEPANGLDPEGIHWMRGLLRSFADDGGAVLLSSHLLREVAAVADDLIMLGGGRVLRHGPVAQLLAEFEQPGTGPEAVHRVRSVDQPLLAAALRARGLPVEQHGDELLVTAAAETIGRAALDARVAVTGLAPARSASLEDYYLHLTSGTARGAAGRPAVGADDDAKEKSA